MAKDKPFFQLERDYIAARDAYHAVASQDTKSDKEVRKLSDAVQAAQTAMSEAITEGAKAGKDQTLVGTHKKAGLFEIVDIGEGGLRAQGETIEEVVFKWNEGEYYTPPVTDELPIGKAADQPAEEADSE